MSYICKRHLRTGIVTQLEAAGMFAGNASKCFKPSDLKAGFSQNDKLVVIVEIVKPPLKPDSLFIRQSSTFLSGEGLRAGIRLPGLRTYTSIPVTDFQHASHSESLPQ